MAARDGTDTEARTAMEALCRTYWPPLYAYVRHQGSNPDEAADLTQGFFADLLDRDFLSQVDPSKGRFRSFLLASLRNFLANERRSARTLKRGGGDRVLSLDTEVAEQAYAGRTSGQSAEQLTPVDVFEQGWATAVLQRAMDRLRQEAASAGRSEQFEALRQYLTSLEPQASYQETAETLTMSEGAVATAVHRLRKQYGQSLRREIAETVMDPNEVDDELRHLLAVVRR